MTRIYALPGESLLDFTTRVGKYMRVPLKETVYFTPAGRTVVRSDGVHTIYGLGGGAIKVTEKPEGGRQIEHGDHLGAVIHMRSIPVGTQTTRMG